MWKNVFSQFVSFGLSGVFLRTCPWPTYFTSLWISLVPASSSYTQHSKLLVKSTFVPSSRGPVGHFRGGWSLCHGVTEAPEWSPPSPLFPSSEWSSLMKDLIARELQSGQREKENWRMAGSHHVGKPKARAVIVAEENRTCYGVLHFPVGNPPMHDLWSFFCWPLSISRFGMHHLWITVTKSYKNIFVTPNH